MCEIEREREKEIRFYKEGERRGGGVNSRAVGEFAGRMEKKKEKKRKEKGFLNIKIILFKSA